jgi:REP element-mobilizing transposase RayT
MVDHLHFIGLHPDLSATVREFKTWTARSIIEALKSESRSDALRRIAASSTEGGRSVWQSGFHPKAITSDEMLLQKMRYIHMNPVRKGLVNEAEHWAFSSAGFYSTGKAGPVGVDVL